MNDDIHDLSGAYALDALDDIERARFEAHLERCGTCQLDVADFRVAATRLGQSAAETPPPSLRAGVLAAIAETRQESPLGRVIAKRRTPLRWFAAVGAAAAAAVIAVLAVQVVSLRDDRDRSAALAEVMTAPDATAIELQGSGGTGRVVWSPSLGRSVVVLDGLPELPADRAYQLWFVVGGEPIPADVYEPRDARVVAPAGDLPEGLEVIGVTEEPAAGSAAPTGPMLLAAEVPPGLA